MRKHRRGFLRRGRHRGPLERVDEPPAPTAEAEDARRSWRDWLRERDETNAIEFEDEDGDYAQ